MATDITVYILEADDSVGCALARLMKSAGHRSVRFSTVEAFETYEEGALDCAVIVADTATARGSGVALPVAWRLGGGTIPVIYLTRQGSESERTEALRVGAAACFRKPVDRQALLDAIAFAARHPERGATGDKSHGVGG